MGRSYNGKPSGMTTQLVSSAVVSSGVQVTGGNILEIMSGGQADGTTVFIFGRQQVDAGGIASGTVISGGFDNVFGAELSAIVNNSGTLNVWGGGTAAHLKISSGGMLNVLGTVTSDVTVFSGGVENISSGGVVGGDSGAGTRLSGGTVNVFAGGAAAFLGVSNGGTLNVLEGGLAVSIGVSSGGVMDLYGTIASNAAIYSGGLLVVWSGGVLAGQSGSGTDISGGTVDVVPGGSESFTTIWAGGELNLIWGRRSY